VPPETALAASLASSAASDGVEGCWASDTAREWWRLKEEDKEGPRAKEGLAGEARSQLGGSTYIEAFVLK